MPNSKQIVYLSQAQYAELIANGTITVDGVTVTYDENDIYVTPQAEPVTDVRINGTSIAANGIANIPIASASTLGLVKINPTGQANTGIVTDANGNLNIQGPTDNNIKMASSSGRPITPATQHKSVFYGLAAASGDTTQSQSSNAVGSYTPEAKGAIQSMLGVSDLIATTENDLVASKAYAVGDIFTANGKLYKVTSAIAADGAIVLQNEGETVSGANAVETKVGEGFVKFTDIATNNDFGIVKVSASNYGLKYLDSNPGIIVIRAASDDNIKNSYSDFAPIVSGKQDKSVFYGLAKAAGDTTQSQSNNAVGQYTDTAKAAIRSMIGAENGDDIVKVQDTEPTSAATKIWLPETPPASVTVPTVAEMEQALNGKVDDVQVNGVSVVSNGVANVPIAGNGTLGVIKLPSNSTNYGVEIYDGEIRLPVVDYTYYKNGNYARVPVTIQKQHISTFYGLAKAAGHDEKNSTESVGTYTPEAKAAIQSMLGVSDLIAPAENTLVASKAYAIGDIFTANGKLYKVTTAIAANEAIILQNDGEEVAGANAIETKVGEGFVKFTDYATASTAGIIRVHPQYGLTMVTDDAISIQPATEAELKAGATGYKPISPHRQHISTFYGLAKAAGDTTQSASSNAVGVYTDNAKASIKAMLGIQDGSTSTVDVSGTTPTIAAVENTRYVCGEVTSLDFTPAASGICIVRFTSGSTVTVLTLPSTVKFPEWFDSTSLETNTIYEICVTDGVYGAVMSWAL